MLATEEMPLTADLPGASWKSNSNRDAGGSRVASNRRDAINSRFTRSITESNSSRDAGDSRGVSNRRDAINSRLTMSITESNSSRMLESVGVFATEETPLTADLP